MLSLKRWHGKRVDQKISFTMDQKILKKGKIIKLIKHIYIYLNNCIFPGGTVG